MPRTCCQHFSSGLRLLSKVRGTLQTNLLVHRDRDLLFRTEIPFRRLDGGVPEQELDLFEVTSSLAAELGAGAAEVVGSEALDPDLFGRPLHHIPDGPVAQALPDPLASLSNGSQEPALVDRGRGHPGVDPLLDPDRHGNRADASSLPFHITQDPAALPQLDGLDVERGELLAAQGAADQQCQDDVVALAP